MPVVSVLSVLRMYTPEPEIIKLFVKRHEFQNTLIPPKIEFMNLSEISDMKNRSTRKLLILVHF